MASEFLNIIASIFCGVIFSSLLSKIWGFRKKDTKRDRQSITMSPPGFEKLCTAL